MGLIGLHGGQIFVLFELWKKDGQRQVDLAKKLDIAAPTIHKMVNGLIEIDLVTRAKYENDARSTRIFITPAGISKCPEIEAQWLELEANCLSCLNATERAVALAYSINSGAIMPAALLRKTATRNCNSLFG